MDFSVTCKCGRVLPVVATMCGQDIACGCGQSIRVPNLSQLRASVGQHPFDASAFDRVKRLAIEGRLPLEGRCVVCGDETKKVLDCTVVCQQPHVTGQGSWIFTLAACCFHLLAIARIFDKTESKIHGHEMIAATPIRLCPTCFAVKHLTRERCRELLRKTQIYRELLEEFPTAPIEFETRLCGERE